LVVAYAVVVAPTTVVKSDIPPNTVPKLHSS
jgi:hypothetical protein